MRRLIFGSLAFVAIGVSQCAKAEDVKVYTGAWSMHSQAPGKKTGLVDYNSNHKLLAVQYKNVLGGWFKNSYDMDTWFLAYAPEAQVETLAFSGMMGLARGYTDCRKGISGTIDNPGRAKTCPFFGAGVHFTKYSGQPGLLVMPKVLAIDFRWRFKL